MSFKKSYGLLFVLLLTPLVLVGVVQSVAPPEIHLSAGSSSVNVYGSGWVAYADVTLYYDVEDADHMVGVVTTKYGGNLQVMIPTNYIPTVGDHTIIAVQGADKATATYNLGISSPPDDRLLNPILSIKDKLESVDTEIQAVEAKLDPNGSFYNFTNDWFSTINETIVEKVDYEAVEIEIHTLQYDTPIDSNTRYDTQVGGADNKSGVYVSITFRGNPAYVTYMDVVPKDALEGFYESVSFGIIGGLGLGLYSVTIDFKSGTPVGSYLVEVRASTIIDGVQYNGIAYYVIDCTSTIT